MSPRRRTSEVPNRLQPSHVGNASPWRDALFAIAASDPFTVTLSPSRHTVSPRPAATVLMRSLPSERIPRRSRSSASDAEGRTATRSPTRHVPCSMLYSPVGALAVVFQTKRAELALPVKQSIAIATAATLRITTRPRIFRSATRCGEH